MAAHAKGKCYSGNCHFYGTLEQTRDCFYFGRANELHTDPYIAARHRQGVHDWKDILGVRTLNDTGRTDLDTIEDAATCRQIPRRQLRHEPRRYEGHDTAHVHTPKR